MAQVRFIHLGNPGPGARIAAFLILTLVVAMLFAIGLLAFGLLLIVTPVLFLVGLGFYLYRKFVPQSGPAPRTYRADIIEGEFHVIDPDAPRITRDANKS